MARMYLEIETNRNGINPGEIDSAMERAGFYLVRMRTKKPEDWDPLSMRFSDDYLTHLINKEIKATAMEIIQAVKACLSTEAE